MKRILCGALLLPCLFALAADFPQPHDTEEDESIPLLKPADAAAAIQLPPGFRAVLFAGEPDVQNPIAMAWDARGRMWVAENYTYAESAKRFDLSLRDRVIILEDADHDGRAEKRRVFTDDVQMLSSVALGPGGVWLMTPPQLLFIPDADGDDVPDRPPQVMLDGFTVSRSNYHNFANGLRFGPDGWLYGRCGHSCPGRLGVPGTPDAQRVPIGGGIWRFHPQRKIVEVLCHGTTNPWGHDWDRNGELFFTNSVNGHLWHMMPGSHLKESTGESDNPAVYERLDTIADHLHFEGEWQDSRNLRSSDMGGGHAHAGMMIYQADQWPAEYRDKLFTLNLHGRRANVERLERHGAGYVGRHDRDIFHSSDRWFRGVEITTGPDGSGYIIDWADIGECHEHNGVSRSTGRIYKISYGQPKPPTAAIYPRCMMGEGKLPQLWRQYQAGQTTPAQLRALLNDPDEHVRVWSIRLLTDFWPLDTLVGPLMNASYPDDPQTRAAFVRMAAEDPSGLVYLVLASVLQRLPLEHRANLAIALVRHENYASDQNLPSLVWYGISPLGDANPKSLVPIAEECRWPPTLRWITRNLASRIETHPKPINALLVAVPPLAARKPALEDGILAGLAEAFRGWRKAPKPEAWDTLAKSSAGQRSPGAVRELSVVFGDGRAVDDIKRIVLDDKLDVPARLTALKSLIDAKPPNLRTVCESLLDVPPLSTAAARGLALFDDPAIARRLIESYRKFVPADRPAVLDVLVSRRAFAKVLLESTGTGKNQIPASDISAVHARQIRSLEDSQLTGMLTEKWGDLRESAADKKQMVAELKSKLTSEVLVQADLHQGRKLYAQTCAACHTLYGEGGKIGPDLTGSGRSDLHYVLENIVDPSAMVSADYRMAIITLKDDRVLSGIVTRQDARTLTLREQAQETTIPRDEITKLRWSSTSMMPDGLLQAMNENQVRDLVGYLMHPKQVRLPEEPSGK
jgi:putative membrane-bound dehydrogenase-like protein